MSRSEVLAELRTFYRTGTEVSLGGLPPGTARLVARTAAGAVVEGTVEGPEGCLGGLPAGSPAIEALDLEGRLLGEELTTVAAHPGERPVHGFATSFEDGAVPGILSWLRATRCTVVQIYDWMERYCAPLGRADGWKDPSNRSVSFAALRALAAGIRDQGGVAHAYAPVYAADPDFSARHPEMMMYRNDGAVQRFFDLIELANPASPEWQRHFASVYGEAADTVGFNGFHIDTYGYPRAARDAEGRTIDLRRAYEAFLSSFRSRRPGDLISFNQVNGVPSAVSLPGGPGFRYCEVWRPNDAFRHLEGLMDRSSGTAGRLGGATSPGDALRGSIACYPPVWEEGASAEGRESSLRTVVLTEAVATSLGGAALLYGDLTAALCDAYYPKHEPLAAGEAEVVLAWRRFALRCRDLFVDGEDTSWYEIADDNGSVAVEWAGGLARPEPAGGSLFARVVRSDRCVAVGVVDLTGSAGGLWSEPTARGRCRSARVRLLVEAPEDWVAAAAVLGRDGGRFGPVQFRLVDHREGRAVEVELPVIEGWSVLRLTR